MATDTGTIGAIPTSSSNQMTVEQFGYKQELKRALGVWDLVLIGMIIAIPIAPFLVFGFVMELSRGQVSLVYALACVLILFTANSYGWLASEFPLAGSSYSYASRAVSSTLGLFTGLILTLDYVIAPASLYVFSAYALGDIIPGVPFWAWIIVFTVVNVTINITGVEITTTVNKVFFVWQIAMLLWFIYAVVTAVANGTNGAMVSTYAFHRTGFFELSVIMAGIGLATYSYVGTDAVTTFAEETKGGAKAIGMGMALAALFSGILFIIVSWLGTWMYPDADNFGDAATSLYQAALLAGGPALQWGITLCMVATASIACSSSIQAAAGRAWFGMARDNMLPRFMTVIHSHFKTPWVTISLVGVICLLVSIYLGDKGDIIGLIISFGALTSFTIVNLSCLYYFTFKKKSKNYLFHLVLPLFGAAFTFYAWLNLDPMAFTIGISWIGFIVVYWAYLKFIRKVPLSLDSLK